MARQSPFELPYQLSGMYCTGALGQLESDDMTAEFPAYLVDRIEAGSGIFGSGCVITQEDIDNLSDNAWEYLKQKLA